MDLSLLFHKINGCVSGLEWQDFAVPAKQKIIPFYRYFSKFKGSVLGGRRENERRTRNRWETGGRRGGQKIVRHSQDPR